LVLAAGALTTALLPRGAAAAAEQVIYNFCPQSGCEDGSYPEGALITDSAGNFYGTANLGGTSGNGTVFRVNPDGTQTVLHNFCLLGLCLDGANPVGGVIMDGSGNLYGTTANGGTTNNGVVFKLTPVGPLWVYTVIHDFCLLTACDDGHNPQGGLVMDPAGNLYGTTINGGTGGSGTVFKLTPDLIGLLWTETVLYNFCSQSGCADGANPQSGVILDTSGNLYGTTYGSGAGSGGTVFKVSPGGTETVLYTFCAQGGSCVDGYGPVGGLVMDPTGTGILYGTTATSDGGTGVGVVFQLTPDSTGTVWTQTVLYTFCAQGGACSDGAIPFAGLILDPAGNLYGTTVFGGNTTSPACTLPGLPTPGCGVVFKLTPDATHTVWTETVPYTFCAQANCADGSLPLAGLLIDGAGNVYGTTAEGGTTNGGVVFTVIAPLM